MSADSRRLLELRAVSFGYGSGRSGIEAADLSVDRGETVVLLGPNGSGKTTLLRLMAGDLEPTSGEIRRLSSSGSAIGYVTDHSTHFDELTGRENAQWFVRAAGEPATAADAMLARFGLTADADHPVGEYSFGMRRRVDLAQALAPEPQLLLLDEPTVGLDPDAMRTLAGVLDERTAAGAAVVIATNDTRLALTADRVAFIHRGRIVTVDSPASLLASVRETVRIEITLDSALREPPILPGGAESADSADGLVVESVRGTADLPAICDAVARAGGLIRRIDVLEPGFDDVFRRLTGEALIAAAADHGPQPSHRGPPWRRRS